MNVIHHIGCGGAGGSFTYMCLNPIHPCAISRDPTKIPFPVELFREGPA